MYPSEVRERILEDHKALRALIKRLSHFLDVDGGLISLISTSRDLHAKLTSHIDLEDEILNPALGEESDAWRAERQDKLHRLHQEHRQLLKELSITIDHAAPAIETLAETLSKLVTHVEADMKTEETLLVSDKVLRDDTVTIGQSGG